MKGIIAIISLLFVASANAQSCVFSRCVPTEVRIPIDEPCRCSVLFSDNCGPGGKCSIITGCMPSEGRMFRATKRCVCRGRGDAICEALPSNAPISIRYLGSQGENVAEKRAYDAGVMTKKFLARNQLVEKAAEAREYKAIVHADGFVSDRECLNC